jgi:RecA-family ATPase
VLDPLAQILSGDENSQEDIRKIVDAMKLIQKAGETETTHGPAVALLCHLNKGNNEAADIDAQLRGSSALAGCYDAHLAIRGTKQKLKLTVRAKEAEEMEFGLTWQNTHTPRLLHEKEDEGQTVSDVKRRKKKE